MATQKPISSISYNTLPFLLEKLQTWYDCHLIQAYQVIYHNGEDGDKNHIHFRIEPNKRLDPMDLVEELKQPDPLLDKPLGCRPFRPSKEEDWFMYAVHDSDYLKVKYGGGDKGEKIPYSWKDIIASPDYDVEIAFNRAKSSVSHTSANIVNRLQKGENAITIMSEGENPFTVRSILSVMNESQYEKLAKEYNDLQDEYFALTEAIYDLGYIIAYDENNRLFISKREEKDDV